MLFMSKPKDDDSLFSEIYYNNNQCASYKDLLS